MLPLLVLLGTIAGAWYLLIVRPQKDQQTRHGRLVERLQVGDHVLTVGGIYGRVVSLEGASVVLELAPGLTSRIATDGIARIVHAGEGAVPQIAAGAAPVAPHPQTQTGTDMHQHPDHQPHTAHQLPPQPFAPPVAQQPSAPVAMPPMPQLPPLQPLDPGVTLRAQVFPALPTFEPRPWGNVAPVGAPQHAVQAPGPSYAAPMQAAPLQAAPMPLHTPFAHAPTHAPYQHAPAQLAPMQMAPLQMIPAPVAAYQQPMPVAVAAPVAHQAAEHEAAPANVAPRRGSAAPKGMGSTLRLDDPSLSDAMSRARTERSDLAVQLSRETAPLVDTAHHAHPPSTSVAGRQGQVPAPHQGPGPNGVALFVAPGAASVEPIAQYPGLARPDGLGAAPQTTVPRPHVIAPEGEVDPVFQAAFQRRAPYAAQVAPAVEPAGAPAHTLA